MQIKPVGDLLYDIGADPSQLQKDLKVIEKELLKIVQKQLDMVDKITNQTVQKQTQIIKNSEKTWNKITENIKVSGIKQENTFEQIEKTSKESYNTAALAAKDYASKAIKSIGAIVVAAGALGVAFKSASDQQEALATFASKTGTTGDLSGYDKSIDNVYKKGLGENGANVADAFVLAKQLGGGSSDQIESMAQGGLSLQRVYGYDLQESFRAADSMVKNFGISYEKAFDLISISTQKGVNKAGDLMDTLSEYSADYKDMGYNADQFIGTLISGIDAGAYNSDKVADAVRELKASLMDEGKQEVLASMGLGNLRSQVFSGSLSMADAYSQVTAALTKMDGAARQTAGVGLFATKWEEQGERMILALSSADKATAASIGNLDKALETRNNTVASKLEKYKRIITTSIGDGLQKSLESAEKAIAKSIGEENVDKALEKIGSSIANLIVLVGKISAVFLAHADVLIPLIATYLAFSQAIQISNNISLMLTVIKGLSGATQAAAIAQWALNIAMSANPIGLAIVAISGLIALILTLTGSWDAVWGVISGVGEDIASIGKWIYDGVVGWIQKIPGALLEFVLGPLYFIVREIGKLFGKDLSIQALFGGGQGGQLPKYEQGTNYVPRTGLALLHEGEAVVPKKYNSGGGSGQGGHFSFDQININIKSDGAISRESEKRITAAVENRIITTLKTNPAR